MKNYLISILLLLFACPLIAQETENNPISTIEVYGTAEKEIIPNEIYIGVTLKERTKGREVESIEDQITNLKKELVEIGIPEEFITMSDAAASYIKVSWKRKDVVAVANFTILVGSAEQVGGVFTIFDELGIQDAFIKHTSHSDITFLRKKVRIEAIKAAKAKATYLLEAIDKELGDPILIKEVPNSGYGLMTSNVIMNEPRQTYQSKQGGTIQFKKIKIQSTIFSQFKIE